MANADFIFTRQNVVLKQWTDETLLKKGCGNCAFGVVDIDFSVTCSCTCKTMEPMCYCDNWKRDVRNYLLYQEKIIRE